MAKGALPNDWESSVCEPPSPNMPQLFAVGGYGDGGTLSSVETLFPAAGTWSTAANALNAAREPCVGALPMSDA